MFIKKAEFRKKLTSVCLKNAASWMWHCVDLVGNDALEKRDRGFFALKMEATRFSKTSILTRPTWCHIPESILNSHRFENLKSYIVFVNNNSISSSECKIRMFCPCKMRNKIFIYI
jgi:hypothetical protein